MPTLPKPARAALIDLDGTLLDTVPDIAAAVNAMLVDMGRAELPMQTVADYVGKGADVLVHRALSGSLDGRVDADQFARGKDAFYRHYRRLNGAAAQIYPGITTALGALRARGVKLACVTNKPREFTRALLQSASLAPYFDAVVSGDDATHRKPHAAPLLEACRLMGVDITEAVMVGDSENDLLAARAAGCPAVLVEGGYNEGRPVSELPADAIVASLIDAVPLLAPSVVSAPS